MKKMLALVLVLGLASVSSAAITMEMQVNGAPIQGSVKPSDIIRICWNNTAGPSGLSGLNFLVDQGEKVSFVSQPSVGTLLSNTLAANQDGMGVRVTGALSAIGVNAGTLFCLEFHVPELPASTIITLDVLAGGSNGLVGPGLTARPGDGDSWPFATLHVIPEPITMTLLGLGGLVLARRRR